MAVKKKVAAPETTLDDALFTIAKKLVSKWDEDNIGSDDRRIALADVASSLGKLVAAELLPTAALSLGGPAGVIAADMAIKSFQKMAGLSDNGVLGKESFSSLSTLITGDEEDASEAPAIPAGSAAPGNPASGLLFYCVEDDLRNAIIGSTKANRLIAEAVFNWVVELDLSLQRTSNPDEANIIMKWENLDGRAGGTLGRAHIGGRGVTQQLCLRFDNNERWQEKTFLNTATHELGHILGLNHVNDQNQLMSRFQNPSIQKPTSADIDRMQAIWGAS